MFLVEGGGEAEMGTSVLVPKSPDMDQDLLALCTRHAVQAPELEISKNQTERDRGQLAEGA